MSILQHVAYNKFLLRQKNALINWLPDVLADIIIEYMKIHPINMNIFNSLASLGVVYTNEMFTVRDCRVNTRAKFLECSKRLKELKLRFAENGMNFVINASSSPLNEPILNEGMIDFFPQYHSLPTDLKTTSSESTELLSPKTSPSDKSIEAPLQLIPASSGFSGIVTTSPQIITGEACANLGFKLFNRTMPSNTSVSTVPRSHFDGFIINYICKNDNHIIPDNGSYAGYDNMMFTVQLKTFEVILETTDHKILTVGNLIRLLSSIINAIYDHTSIEIKGFDFRNKKLFLCIDVIVNNVPEVIVVEPTIVSKSVIKIDELD